MAVIGIQTKNTDLDRRLDDAIADSFPASDPVSLAQPQDPEELGVSSSSVMSPTAWLILGGGLLAVLAVIALRR